MSVQDILEKIKVWFETGDENSNDIVEMPWDVEVDHDVSGNIKTIIAVNPRMPIRFHVFPLENVLELLLIWVLKQHILNQVVELRFIEQH